MICHCVDQATHNEYYLNGTQYVIAGDFLSYDDNCTHNYEFQVLTKLLTRENVIGACIFANGTYGVLTESRIYVPCNQGAVSCAPGQKSLKSNCYKSIPFEHPRGVEKLTSSDISTKCGYTGST